LGFLQTNTDGFTPLYAAALNSHLEIVRLLLQNGFVAHNPNVFDLSCLHVAARQGYVEMARFLVEQAKLDINGVSAFGATAVDLAEWSDQHEVMKLLQHMGASKRRDAARLQFCTYLISSSIYVKQVYYRCNTCSLVGNQGCCAVCKEHCHQGHDVSEQLNGFFLTVTRPVGVLRIFQH